MSKKISQLTALANTSLAPDDYLVILDSSAGTTKKIQVSDLVGIPDLVGWTATGESWSYCSYSSTTQQGVVTVPSNATNKYSKGMKVRFVQDAITKYFYIIDLTSTSLTITGGSDYTLTSSAITSSNYSVQATPFGFPHTFNYTPVWSTAGTAPAVGNGTLTGSFRIVGRLVHVWVKLVFGSSTTSGTSGWNFSMPATVSSSFSGAIGSGVGKTMIGTWYGENPAVSGYGGFLRVTSSTQVTPEYVNNSIAGGMTDAQVGAPASWASGWYLLGSGAYELA